MATKALEQFLTDTLAGLVDCDPGALSVTDDFDALGVDSLVCLRFTRKIQDFTGREMAPEWLFDHPSIRMLADFLSQQPGMPVANPSAL